MREEKARWEHLGPCQHVVQFYRSDEALMDTLEEFLGSGLREGESTLVIATGAHLDSLEHRLRASGIDLAKARAADRYLPLDADRMFDLFMASGRFDRAGFFEVVGNALARCKAGGRRVRVFGELVALLWARRHYATALQLEEAWQAQSAREQLSVLCSYPQADFSGDAARMIGDICAAHTDSVFA
jgi:DcmR-like sensory protein